MAKDIDSIFFDITPEIEELALNVKLTMRLTRTCIRSNEVKRGLR